MVNVQKFLAVNGYGYYSRLHKNVGQGLNIGSGTFGKKNNYRAMNKFLHTLISLITVEVGINVEGVQKLQNK